MQIPTRKVSLGIGVALVAALIARAALAEPPATVFHAIDSAPVVVIATVQRVEKLRDGKLLVFHLAPSGFLKGTARPSLRVVQELVFHSDKPQLSEAQAGVFVLDTFTKPSAYGAVLPGGDYFRAADARAARWSAVWREPVQKWIETGKLGKEKQPAPRLALLVEWLARPELSSEAAAELERLPYFNAGLDDLNLMLFGQALRTETIAIETRRRLILALATQQAMRALRLLDSLTTDPRLGAFARQALAALGVEILVEASIADLHRDEAALRIAALRTISASGQHGDTVVAEVGAVARGERNQEVRLAAIDCLAAMGDDGVPQLTLVLADADRRFVYKASLALAQVATPAAVQALARPFESGSYDAQVSAVFALRQIATPEALAILERVRNDPPDPRLRKVIGLAENEVDEHE